MELMKVGRDKRAFKYVKARVCIFCYCCFGFWKRKYLSVFFFQLGSHQRAKKKRDELQAAILAQRKAHK